MNGLGNTHDKQCTGFVKQIDTSNVKDQKLLINSREQNGNVVNSLPCTPCDTSNSPPNFTIRPQTSVDESLPLMNITWPGNNAGCVGTDAEEAI